MFSQANKIDRPRAYQVVSGAMPSGMDRLIQAARQGRPLTPEEVMRGDARAGMILGLGDLYFIAEEHEKVRGLYHLVLDQERSKTITSAQKAWAAFMIARTHFWRFQFEDARKFYHVVFEQYPDVPWAATVLYYNATMVYSNLATWMRQ